MWLRQRATFGLSSGIAPSDRATSITSSTRLRNRDAVSCLPLAHSGFRTPKTSPVAISRHRPRPQRPGKLCEAVATLVAVLGIRQGRGALRLQDAVADFAERNAGGLLNAARLGRIFAKRKLVAPLV